MISKKYEQTHGDSFSSGGGRPFDMRDYKSPAKNDAERNTPVPIDLNDLERPGKGPVNFSRSAGRRISGITDIG